MSDGAGNAENNDASALTERAADCAAEFLWKMADKTVSMEEARCESLRRMCDGLLTGSSIASVAVLTVAEPLLAFFGSSPEMRHMLLALYAVVVLLLLLSMIFTVISMTRFKYVATGSPDAIRNAVRGYEKHMTSMQAAESYVEALEKLYQGYLKRNNKMRGLLVAAQWMLVAALVIVVIGGGILLAGGLTLLG